MPAEASRADRDRGSIVFSRDWMRDIYYNDRPLPGERVGRLSGSAFAGESVDQSTYR